MRYKLFVESSDQLKKGIAHEKEHAGLYHYLENFLDKYDIDMPLTLDEFSGKIAQDHIKENPDYYDMLEKMEKEWKSK